MATWTVIRKHYAALLHDSGLSQQEVARRGGLKRNNGISRLLKNTKRGPSVDTLTKAVDGLGLSLGEFFAGIEESRPGAQPLSARVDAIEIALTTLRDDLAVVAGAQPRRRHDTPDVQIVSTAGSEAIGTITLSNAPRHPAPRPDDDLARRVSARIHATVDSLIDGIAAEVDAALRARRDVDSDAARNLSGRGGSLRRPAGPPRPPHVKDMLKEVSK
jgi:transcriptional regulator with XRE-family HTH domain